MYNHYTAENGLPHDITYQIIQDTKGFIWIGTDDGFTMFNGTTFSNYSSGGLKSNYVIDILEDVKNDQFLLATWGGGLHSLKNDSIYKFTDKKDRYTKINKLYLLNDSLIYGASNNSGHYFYNMKNKKVTPLQLQYNSKKGELYWTDSLTGSDPYIKDINLSYIDNKIYAHASELNTTEKNTIIGAYIINNNTVKKVNIPKLNSKPIHAITKNNGYLITSSFNKLYFYDENQFLEQRKLPLNPGKIIQLKVFNNNIYLVFINKIDGLRELYCYNFQNNHLTNISKKLHLKSSVSDFIFDTNRSLWITTYGQGVYQLLDTKNVFFDASFFENPDLRDITSNHGAIITIAPNIIYHINEKQKVTSKKIPFHTEYFQLKGNDSIQLIMHNKKEDSYQSSFLNYTLLNKTSKSFIFPFDSSHIEVKQNTYTSYKNNQIVAQHKFHADEGSFVRKAIVHKGKIYAVFGRLGIHCLDMKTGKAEKWDQLKNIYANNFTDIAIQDTTIWVGTNIGVFKITPSKTTQHTTNEGLLSNHINSFYIDSHNLLWVATQKGLNVLYENTYYSIDKSLGQESTSIKKITEENNYIYATGNKGLFKLDNISPFHPAINTKLIIEQNHYNFTINTINYINPKSITVDYQLNNNSWVTVLNNELTFKNLKQGIYQIIFRYKDNLSEWKYSKPYTFKVTLPWYQQIWFYITITIFILGWIMLFLFWGLQKSIKKNKELKKTIDEKEKLQKALKEVRKNVARDFHDELGNKLASISLTSNMLIDTTYTTNTENKEKKLKQIKKDADYLYHGMKDFIWSLDHKNDDLQQLQVYLNDFGESLFENTTIAFYSTHNFSTQKIILPFYWSKQLVLIFKEAMTNVLKHSKATKVYLNFEQENNILKIILKDNGIGFKMHELNRLNGIKNMQHRANSLHQQITIKANNGVIVTFTGTLKEEQNE